ncbi:MAG: response regulator [Thaumarchaeota archaeon]|nr:response regulator [Nitrososphaerota archaeon]
MAARRILVVDDERDITDALKIGLQQHGFVVDAYYDPVEALAKFKPGVYDVVISDIKLPKMNGFEMVYEMQEMDSGFEVLFLTGHVDMYQELSKLFTKMKIREVIQKPIAISQLAEKIKALETSPGENANFNSALSLEQISRTLRRESSSKPESDAPRKELLETILKTVSRGRGTLGNIAQQMRPKLEFTWDEFIGAVNYLVAKGRLQSKGDGFEVLYSITEEGEKQVQ